MKNIFIVN